MSLRKVSLSELQATLIAATANPGVSTTAPEFLPFEAAGRTWAVKSAEVGRLMMPTDVTLLQGYAVTPECVMGVIAADSEMLSVVDGGLLLGTAKTVNSLKSRLIVFAEGPLKGIALMVDRVRERVDNAAGLTDISLLTPANLLSKLNEKAGAIGEKQ